MLRNVHHCGTIYKRTVSFWVCEEIKHQLCFYVLQ